jgi:predicted AlkP superfamily phosphohydrolase/phosphomutase
MGGGNIYLTHSGPEREAFRQALRGELERLTDPLSGQHVVSRVRFAAEVFRGAHVTDAPDLLVSWAPGYGPSWEAWLGRMSSEVVAANGERWLAGYPGADEARVPGVWLSNVPVGADTMSVLDVGPTIMAFFGLSAGSDAEGKSQLRAMPNSISRR